MSSVTAPCRRGGFKIGKNQFCVSKAFKSLEDELDMPLFNRAGHKVWLTAAGEIACQRALVLLSERSDMLAEINELLDLKRGRLRIGQPPVGCRVLFAAMFGTYRKALRNCSRCRGTKAAIF